MGAVVERKSGIIGVTEMMAGSRISRLHADLCDLRTRARDEGCEATARAVDLAVEMLAVEREDDPAPGIRPMDGDG
ncbi:hypothetical protein [Roseobacter sp. HKCCA0434]|uniref:hypothetical protein n=1 Tax=Roseobacter sp. HKCCA0434 TaxID=3079297 RepID=UPI002905C718|nr:hypothetical protein [Roseobacter sp. HKCCA0434]